MTMRRVARYGEKKGDRIREGTGYREAHGPGGDRADGSLRLGHGAESG